MAKKKVNPNSKAAKYFKAHVLDGMNKSQASKVAGITSTNNINKVEATQTYQILEQKYADVMETAMSKSEVVDELMSNVKQNGDRGAKNAAIKMWMDRVEPEILNADSDEQMIVVLRK